MFFFFQFKGILFSCFFRQFGLGQGLGDFLFPLIHNPDDGGIEKSVQQVNQEQKINNLGYCCETVYQHGLSSGLCNKVIPEGVGKN